MNPFDPPRGMLSHLGPSAVHGVVGRIWAPSRLHFGLLELCEDQPHRFGGLGVMIDALPTIIEFEMSHFDEPSSWFDLSAGASEHVGKIQDVLAASSRLLGLPTKLPQCRLIQSPPPHSGFGSGTQFAASLATVLAASQSANAAPFPTHSPSAFETVTDSRSRSTSALRIWQVSAPCTPIEALQQCTLRGKRSYVGLTGFLHGGLIVDRGWDTGETSLGGVTGRCRWQRTERFDLPYDWTLVLILPDSESMPSIVSGELESDWIGQCSRVPNPNRDRMIDLINLSILPSLKTGDFEEFCQAIETYGRLAGMLFAPIQGGPFRDKRAAQLAEHARELGGLGIGQSSWGPTIFSWFQNDEQAEWFLRRWHSSFSVYKANLFKTKVCNHGAQLTWNRRMD